VSNIFRNCIKTSDDNFSVKVQCYFAKRKSVSACFGGWKDALGQHRLEPPEMVGVVGLFKYEDGRSLVGISLGYS
jgi:hypothetical protein